MIVDWQKMEVTFSRDRYHEHYDMIEWCYNNIGTGCWTYSTPLTWEGMGANLWIVHGKRGNTIFAFKNAKHLTLFILRWCKQ